MTLHLTPDASGSLFVFNHSVGSHGSSSLPFVMKVMVCHFVSDSHEVMTALIVMLHLIVVVEISLQLHRYCFQPFTIYSLLAFSVQQWILS
jgi:hypothetical protein